MDKLTSDLQGVAVYMDDILVSGATASEHLQNLRSLLKCLEGKGLRCRLEKCSFAQSSIEYLGHTLSQQGISKGKKVDAVKLIPPPENVSTLLRLCPILWEVPAQFGYHHRTTSLPNQEGDPMDLENRASRSFPEGEGSTLC